VTVANVIVLERLTVVKYWVYVRKELHREYREDTEKKIHQWSFFAIGKRPMAKGITT
jgi:hypothetical protein